MYLFGNTAEKNKKTAGQTKITAEKTKTNGRENQKTCEQTKLIFGVKKTNFWVCCGVFGFLGRRPGRAGLGRARPWPQLIFVVKNKDFGFSPVFFGFLDRRPGRAGPGHGPSLYLY